MPDSEVCGNWRKARAGKPSVAEMKDHFHDMKRLAEAECSSESAQAQLSGLRKPAASTMEVRRLSLRNPVDLPIWFGAAAHVVEQILDAGIIHQVPPDLHVTGSTIAGAKASLRMLARVCYRPTRWAALSAGSSR